MNTFKTIILGTDKEAMTPLGEHITEVYQDEVFMTYIRMEFEEYLNKNQPDLMLIDISTQLSAAEKKNIIESVEILQQKNPGCIVIAYGGKKTTIKDKGFQEAVDVFSGKTVAKIGKDYGEMRTKATAFFAPYLIGNYEDPGFDRLLNQTYSREDNLQVLDALKTKYNLFRSLLKEENRDLIDSTFNIYQERDLTHEEIENIQSTFFFQFTTLTAMENFIDRRRYYAEKDVITNVWESTIAYAREIENSIIFGCHKLGDVVHLKLTIPVEYDLKKISTRSKFYKIMESIEPYGTMTIRSGSQLLSIGIPDSSDSEETVEGTIFRICINVVVPARGRRGLKRH